MRVTHPGPALRTLRTSRPHRRAAARRIAAALVALAVMALVEARLAELRRIGPRLVSQRQVWVTTHAVAEGDEVGPSLHTERRPPALVPHDALSQGPPPEWVATTDLVAGEVVVGSRVAAPGSGDPPDHHSTMTVVVEGSLPPLEEGDEVDLLAASVEMDPLEADAAPPRAVPVARSAIVLAVQGSGSITVAVRDTDTAATAGAMLAGPLAVVVRGR